MLEQLLSSGAGIVVPFGQMTWTTPGTYEWTVPEGVETICAIVVAAGSHGSVSSSNAMGGHGGAIRWQNNIPVTPGQIITVTVGNAGDLTYQSTANILTNQNETQLQTRILNLWAGPYNLGTTYGGEVTLPTVVAPMIIGGGNGGVYDTTGYNKLNAGGSAASFNTRNGTAGSAGGANRGINIVTGSFVTAQDPGSHPYSGRSAGGGGSAIPKAQNIGNTTNNQVWRGGHGAARIIWGSNRWYPDRNVTDK